MPKIMKYYSNVPHSPSRKQRYEEAVLITFQIKIFTHAGDLARVSPKLSDVRKYTYICVGESLAILYQSTSAIVARFLSNIPR